MPENRLIMKTDVQQIPSAYLSDRGRVRQNNEDRLVVCNYFSTEIPPREILLAVLSDGVGGHQAGEVAAQVGVDTVVESVSSLDSLENPGRALFDAVLEANLAVLKEGKNNPQLDGMGATLMSALIIQKTLYLAYLGDSRAYLLRGRLIRQLNYDHTWLREAAGNEMAGIQNMSRDHPLAHVLSRYLGSPHPAPVDSRICQIKKPFQKTPKITAQFELQMGDRLLLCSDGLTDMMTDMEIRSVVKGKDLQQSVKQLVEAALDKGGHDNVSVILAEIT